LLFSIGLDRKRLAKRDLIALDSGKEVRVVFCDISKAFDRVWHKGLIHKLKKSGIAGNLLKWFQNYLYGREQRVVINSGIWVYNFLRRFVYYS
jgi:hypothetical protein